MDINNEEINIAIAESLGWKNCKVLPKPQKYWDVSNVPEMVRIGSPPVAGSCTFPDYCNNLNAVREAEERLDDKQRRDFAFRLLLALCDGSAADLSEYFDLLHASARQRAEAYLKTLGKWQE